MNELGGAEHRERLELEVGMIPRYRTETCVLLSWQYRQPMYWLWAKDMLTVGECLFLAMRYEEELIRRHVARF